MSLQILESLVESDFGYSHTDGKWGKAKKHDSFIVNRETAHWFWNSRGLNGDLLGYLTKVRGLDIHTAKSFLTSVTSSLSTKSFGRTNSAEPYSKLVDMFWENGKNNREYWYRRCLTDETIDRYRLGYINEWYTIPLYKDGSFYNFQCRRDIPEKAILPWYKGLHPVLFNTEILHFVKTVYITEGLVDAILLNQLGYSAVGHNAGANYWNPEWSSLFTGVNTIYYIADNDKAGVVAAELISKTLGAGRVKIIIFNDMKPKADFMDYYRDGFYTQEDFSRRVDQAKYYFEGIRHT